MTTKNNDVPYIVHEGAMARADRTIKRLWICILMLIVLLVVSNACWIWYESQFEQVTETTTTGSVTQDRGNNTYIGGDNNGSADNQNKANKALQAPQNTKRI